MAEKKKKNSVIGGILDIVEIIVQALVIIFIIFTFCFRVSGVVGESMEPTLQNGDWLALTNVKYQPKQGDIVVITQPTGANEPLIKRVIATEGQTVSIEDGVVKVDGEAVDYDFIPPTYRTFDYQNGHVVKEGCVFCMGDNRNNSWDSRASDIGDIDVRYIIGEARCRLMPFNKFGIEKNGRFD
ncbi:MAG: signal peptidase I [Clostridia bacterium]|nr:signal peptidase I [Clostridia bacterium]